MARTKTVTCVKCRARIPRSSAFGVSGLMNMATLSIDYKTFRCANEKACKSRTAPEGAAQPTS